MSTIVASGDYSVRLAVIYVLCDTYDKASRALQESAARIPEAAEGQGWSRAELTRLVTSERAIDTLLWQLLASVAIPGFVVHCVVQISHTALTAGLHLDEPASMAPAALEALVSAANAVGASVPQARLVLHLRPRRRCRRVRVPQAHLR